MEAAFTNQKTIEFVGGQKLNKKGWNQKFHLFYY